MTHSHHRQGSVESLKNDFVMFAYCAKGINMEGAGPKLRRIAEIVFDAGPVNAGSSRENKSIAAGTWDKETAMEAQSRARSFIACFDDRERIKRVLERLKEEDLGISVTLSGLTEDVMELAREVGLTPHTANVSLGVWGNKAKLPEGGVLEFSTMCGHSLVAFNLVKKALAEVAAGTMTPEEAARMAGEPCNCGIVNLARGARLLQREA